jgi:CDP-diacylglycerol--glycerol-3-phosphate 3-phosphatidyltransferase
MADTQHRPQRTRPRRRGGSTAGRAHTQQLVRDRLIESRLTPNAISLTGFALNLAAAALVFERLFLLAGLAFIVGSVMDTLDGRYSRMSGKGTQFGAFLDSTLDRLEEGIVLTAVGAYFASRHDQLAVAAVVAAVLFSLMVSYTRARAEALGVECKVGLATRPVRVVILSIGLVLAHGAGVVHVTLLAPAVYALAALSLFTVCQRIWHVRGELRRPGGGTR